MENSLTGPFAQILKANRARFNAKFAEARRYRPKLSAEASGEHLRSVVAPIVEAVARENPAATAETAEMLYDLSLDLIGQELIGPPSRYPALNAGWSSVLPSLPHHLAAAPRAVVCAVTNALYNLALSPTARPNEWMQLMRETAPFCPDVDTLLKVGQVAAWQCGMAHYRQGALEICRTLDEKIVCAVLSAPATSPIKTVEPSGDHFLITDVANKISRAFPELANAASAAATPTTLAVTTALSHSVYHIAFAE